MKKMIIGMIVIMIALAGCGQKTADPKANFTDTNEAHLGGNPNHEDTGVPANTDSLVKSEEIDDDMESEELEPNDNEVDTEEETGSQSPEPADGTAPVPVTHYMTEHYIFKPIDEVNGDSKVVLLTFDDGPKDEALVETMLDILGKHQAKAIFFVNGYRVQAKPELLKLIHDRGQTIGNHSWDHIVLSKQTEEVMRQQVGDVQRIVEDITGEAPRFFRPPHGAGNELLKQIVKDENMLYMTWSNGSKDWEKDFQQPDLIIEQVLNQLHRGSNILMHELPWTVEALDHLLTRLTEEGYSFLDPAAIRLEDGESSSPTPSDQPSTQ